MKQIILIGLVSLVWLMDLNCISSRDGQPVPEITPAEKKEIAAIKESFAQLADAMATGDPQKAARYVSSQEWHNRSVESFIQEYNQNKTYWQSMFRGAYLTTIGFDNSIASSVVIWGTSASGLLEFIKEQGGWKLLNMRPPAPVITPLPLPPGGTPPGQ